MDKIFENNLNLLASTATIATIALMLTTDGNAEDSLIQAISGVIRSNVEKQFQVKQGVEFDIQKHEIPTEYCVEALQRVLTIARMAAVFASMDKE